MRTHTLTFHWSINMYDDLKGKVALITGSGKKSGIGYGIAKKLASCGADIIVSDLGNRNVAGIDIKTGATEEMEEIVKEIENTYSVRALAVEMDVTDSESIKEMADQVKNHFEHLDILCNNAGASIGVPNAVHTYDEDAWMKTIDINLHGVFRVTRAVLPMMMGRQASIVNMASKAGKEAPLFNGAYAVAKAGVIMLTKVMAKELAGAGIRVNAVCPGVIDTDLSKWRFGLEAQFFESTMEAREEEMNKTIPLGRLGTIDEVACLTSFLCSSDSSYMTGQAINITGGQLM